MGDTLSLVTTCLCTAARLLVVWNYCRMLYEMHRRRWSVVACTAAFAISIFSSIYLQNLAVNLAMTFVALVIIAVTYKGNIWKKLICSFILLAVSMALDLLAKSITAGIPSIEHRDILSCVLSVFLFFASSVLAGITFKRKEKYNFSWEWWYILVVTCSSLGLVIFLAYDNMASQLTIIVLSILIFGITFVLYNLCMSISDKYALKNENIILRSQMDIYEYKIKNDIQREQLLKTMRHDMKHHIRELYHYIEAGNNREALEYLDAIGLQLQHATGRINTGVSAVDGVLDYMVTRAEQLGIKVSAHLTIPETLNVSSYDMNVILGNLMQNAIEAAEKCQNGEILIHIRYDHGCLFITLKNSYSGKTSIKDGKYISTKRNAGDHGLGLKSVSTATKKYNGKFKITEESGMFVVDIAIAVDDII